MVRELPPAIAWIVGIEFTEPNMQKKKLAREDVYALCGYTIKQLRSQFSPILAELIEATHCTYLLKRANTWTAQADRKTSTGKSPNEAVARLWLALNRKA